MVTLPTIRANNSSLHSRLPSNLVAVFVGGTSGIGLSTAREFIASTTSPTVYLIGRNESEASRIIPELQALNPSSSVEFVKSDVSLLKNVDEVCERVKEKEKKVNLLFMTVGYVTMKGREPTSEGLDRKVCLHSYTRIRLAQQLAPLLNAAGSANELSRVVSVLDPNLGRNAAPNFSDLSLKTTFSLRMAGIHASAIQTMAFEHLAKANPTTSYIHTMPGIVHTNAFRETNFAVRGMARMLGTVLRPWSYDIKESGERHLWASTAEQFAAQTEKKEGVEGGVAKGSDDVEGSGAYMVNHDSEVISDSQVMRDMRKHGAVEKVCGHLEEVYKRVCEEKGVY